jgi:class 3 adenylate cyclase
VHQETRYTRNRGIALAWTATDPRPIDLLLVLGTVTQLEQLVEEPGMAAFVGRLARVARVIRMDRRGLGLSDRPEGPILLDDEVSDLGAVLDAAGSERAVVFAHASGGPPALRFAARHPERVQALVLYAAMASFAPRSDLFFGEEHTDRAALFARMAEQWGTGAMAGQLAPSRADDPALRAWLARLERLSMAPGAVSRYAEQVADHDARADLAHVRVPTLILHRRGDRMVDVRHSRYIAERIAGARLVELEGADHIAGIGGGDELLEELEEFLTGGRRTIERELLTVLLTDVVDATGHAARLGDRRWRELLTAQDVAVRREVERFGGRAVKSIGDAVLGTFAGPPSDAVRAAAAIVAAVRPLGLEVRAGLHTGECEVLGDDVGGMAVHIAARVASLAAPGEVLASGTTYGTVVGAGLRFEDRGAQALRGVPGRWPLFALRP